MTKSWGVSHCNESSNYFLSTSRCVHVTVSDNSFEPVRATWKSELLIEQQPVFHRHLPKIVSCRKLVSQHQGSVILQTALTELGHYYYLCLLLFAKCVYGFSLFCEYCHCLFPLFFLIWFFFSDEIINVSYLAECILCILLFLAFQPHCLVWLFRIKTFLTNYFCQNHSFSLMVSAQECCLKAFSPLRQIFDQS